MKKPLQYWFSFVLILLIGSEMLISCKAKQLPPKEITIETHTSDTTKELSNRLLEKSLATNDSLKLLVAKLITGNKECDSLCNEQFQQWLGQINLNKSSGNNEMGMYYDKLNNLFVMYQKQGETINELNERLKESNKTESASKVETTPVYIKEPLTWYEKTLMLTGLVLGAWQIFKLINFFKSKIPT